MRSIYQSIFSHRLARLVKRALGKSWWRKESSIHSTPTSLIPGPARHAQSLERDQRSGGEHVKSSTKEFQLLKPVNWLHPSPRTHFKYLCANASSMKSQQNRVLCMLAGLWSYQCHRDVVGWLLWLSAGMEWWGCFTNQTEETSRGCCLLCQWPVGMHRAPSDHLWRANCELTD